MINNLINTTDVLSLQSNVRLSATSSFNFQEASENIFEDMVTEESNHQEVKNKEEKINLNTLGKPSGFEMYENYRENELNPLSKVQMKLAINNYLLQDYSL